MRFALADRTELAMLLNDVEVWMNRNPMRREGTPSGPPPSRSIWVCWPNDQGLGDMWPRLVIVRDGDLNDFHAWAVTFLPGIRPLTSLLRVLSWSQFSLPGSGSGGEEPLISRLLLGAVLGEALMNSDSGGFMESLPVAAFESTYFGAVSQAIAGQYTGDGLAAVHDGWHQARILTEQRARRDSPESFAAVTYILSRIGSLRGHLPVMVGELIELDSIASACRELAETGEVSVSTLVRLNGEIGSAFFLTDSMRAPREVRVEIFERLTHSVLESRGSNRASAFLIGYVASLIGNGSLEHAPLIRPIQGRLPEAMLWYGICAALMPNNRIESYGSYLGLRIKRSLQGQGGVLSVPVCDISIDELSVILRGAPHARAFRRMHSSLLKVEIAPLVTTVVKWPSRQDQIEQLSLFSRSEPAALHGRQRIADLLSSIKQALALAEDLDQDSQASPNASSAPHRSRKRRSSR
jgi:hypothetical protein